MDILSLHMKLCNMLDTLPVNYEVRILVGEGEGFLNLFVDKGDREG